MTTPQGCCQEYEPGDRAGVPRPGVRPAAHHAPV